MEPWRDAVSCGADRYVDPATGYMVFTEAVHRRRGTCCGGACRHCPFGHEQVRAAKRPLRTHAPTLLMRGPATGTPVDVVFWSGGKDAWLAYRAVAAEGRKNGVAHDVRPRDAPPPSSGDPRRDYRRTGRPRGSVTHPRARRSGLPYVATVMAALDIVHRRWPVATLVFGDLRLEDVRRAREAALRPWCEARGPPDGFRCGGSRMKTLLERLESSGATVTITASSHPSVAVGARLVARVARGSSPRRRSLRRKRRVPHARRLVARSFDYRSRASRSVVM
jgi:ATP-binding cassette subfamily B (MDR/TAP) protein 1